MMRAQRRSRNVAVAVVLAFGFTCQLAFVGVNRPAASQRRLPRAPQTAEPLQSAAEELNFLDVEQGKEYTGRVTQVTPFGIDVEFKNGDTTFPGNLHVADMGSETRIETAGDKYSVGDEVTATAWKFQRRRVRMSKNSATFANKKLLKDFMVGDTVTGTFMNRGGVYAFFDVGSFVDGVLNVQKHDIGELKKGDIKELKVTMVKNKIILGI